MAAAAKIPMAKAPVTFTTIVPQGNVSPTRRPINPDTKNRAAPPSALPNATHASPIKVSRSWFNQAPNNPCTPGCNSFTSSNVLIHPRFTESGEVSWLISVRSLVAFSVRFQIDAIQQHVNARDAEPDGLPDRCRQHHDGQQHEGAQLVPPPRYRIAPRASRCRRTAPGRRVATAGYICPPMSCGVAGSANRPLLRSCRPRITVESHWRLIANLQTRVHHFTTSTWHGASSTSRSVVLPIRRL